MLKYKVIAFEPGRYDFWPEGAVHKDTRYEIENGRIHLFGEGWRSNRNHCIEYNPDSRQHPDRPEQKTQSSSSEQIPSNNQPEHIKPKYPCSTGNRGISYIGRNYAPILFDSLITIYSQITEFLFDTEQLVVLGHTVGAAE